MSEPSSEATVVSEESAPETTVQEQTQTQPATTSFAEALKQAAREGGHQLGTDFPPTEEKAPEPEATQTETEPESETPVEAEAETQPPAEEQTEPPKGLSISDQLNWYKDHGKEAPWYLGRIAEQSATLAKRTERLEKAEQRAQELEAQLSKQSGPQPTREQPFANVWDRDELKKLENTYEELLKVATLHPNGVE